jgi:hypothetical protein
VIATDLEESVGARLPAALLGAVLLVVEGQLAGELTAMKLRLRVATNLHFLGDLMFPYTDQGFISKPARDG